MLERLIEDYSDRGFQFAYSLCGNVDEAQDMVQEAFFRVIKGWDGFDQGQDFGNWFISILRNIYLDASKRCERRLSVSLDTPLADGDEDAETFADVLADGDGRDLLERLARAEGQRDVQAAFERLTEDARAILTLCDVQGLSYEEIGRVTGLNLGTVRSRLCRARRALRRALSGSPAAEEVIE